MTKVQLDKQLLKLQNSRFSLTEELRKNSVSNSHSKVIKLKDRISKIDESIETINDTKYKDMK